MKQKWFIVIGLVMAMNPWPQGAFAQLWCSDTAVLSSYTYDTDCNAAGYCYWHCLQDTFAWYCLMWCSGTYGLWQEYDENVTSCYPAVEGGAACRRSRISMVDRGSISIIAEGEKHEKNTIADFSYGVVAAPRVDRLQT